jgi:anti-sigma regulatory factor (Ser/Thr protein kinase)
VAVGPDVDGSPWDDGDPLVSRALAAVAGAVPLGLAVLSPGGRLARANDAFAELAGRPARDCLGLSLAEVLGEPGRRLAGALSDVGPGGVRQRVAGRARTGEAVDWHVTAVPLDRSAHPSLAICLQQAAAPSAGPERTREELTRLELLTRAGELMVSSLEPAETLENLCDLLVPAVADHAFVDLHDGDVLRRVAIAHAAGVDVDPGLQRPVGLPAGYTPGHPVLRAFEQGEVLVVPDYAADAGAVPEGRDTDFFRVMDVTTAAVVPLRAGARVLGTVVLACSVSGRHYGPDDMALVMELVERAAAAVTNSLRFAEQRSAAVELQRSLLPQSLDPVEGLDVAWRYVPGTDGTEVGGDWADVVELPGGRVALVIGDVMGRGLRAAAVMGQLRTAVRTLAMQDPPPADLLTQLDSIVAGLGGDQIVTCVYGVYDPARGTVAVANAGHLPPLLVMDGRCQPLAGVSAVPLGVGGVEFTERVVAMPRGALLALYTDGLVERRGGDLEDDVSRLGQVLLDARGSLGDRASAVLMRSAPGVAAGFHDDVALLLVQALADPSEVAARHVLPAEPASVAAARRATARTLGSWGLGDEELQATGGLLVSELVTNAVRYAEGSQVELVLRRGESAVWVEVGDRDTRSPRMRHASPDDEGGRGLALVQALSAAWGTRATPDGMVVWIRMDLPDSGPVPRSP